MNSGAGTGPIAGAVAGSSAGGSTKAGAIFSCARVATGLAALAMLVFSVLVVRAGVLEAAGVMNTFSGYKTLPAALGMASYLLVGTIVAATGLLAAWRLARRALGRAATPKEAARLHKVPMAGAVLIAVFALFGVALWAGPYVIRVLDLSGSTALGVVKTILAAFGDVAPVCTIGAGITLVVLIAAGMTTRSARMAREQGASS